MSPRVPQYYQPSSRSERYTPHFVDQHARWHQQISGSIDPSLVNSPQPHPQYMMHQAPGHITHVQYSQSLPGVSTFYHPRPTAGLTTPSSATHQWSEGSHSVYRFPAEQWTITPQISAMSITAPTPIVAASSLPSATNTRKLRSSEKTKPSKVQESQLSSDDFPSAAVGERALKRGRPTGKGYIGIADPEVGGKNVPAYVRAVKLPAHLREAYARGEGNNPFSPLARPPMSYAALIGQALLTCEAPQALTICEIFCAIAQRYPYYSANPKLLYNGVRHAMTISEAFVKLPREWGDQSGKARKWAIKEGCADWFDHGSYVRGGPKARDSNTVWQQQGSQAQPRQSAPMPVFQALSAAHSGQHEQYVQEPYAYTGASSTADMHSSTNESYRQDRLSRPIPEVESFIPAPTSDDSLEIKIMTPSPTPKRFPVAASRVNTYSQQERAPPVLKVTLPGSITGWAQTVSVASISPSSSSSYSRDGSPTRPKSSLADALDMSRVKGSRAPTSVSV